MSWIGFPIGLVVANFGEWLIHKYILHGQGKKKDAFWSHHWSQHHRDARRSDGIEPSYSKPFWQEMARKREAFGLIGASIVVSPLLLISVPFVLGLWTDALLYYVLHRKSHTDTGWARKYLPWHYDHHLGRNQHSNWCVTYPLADYVLGTREKWSGTQAETEALARIAARKASKDSTDTTTPAED